MMSETRFHHLPQQEKDSLILPERLNDPFNYTPHPLCLIAANETRKYIENCEGWLNERGSGKMFGVLIVRTGYGEIGFLAAFSGLLGRENDITYFVPPVYNLLKPDDFFKVGEKKISEINEKVNLLKDTLTKSNKTTQLNSKDIKSSDTLGSESLIKSTIIELKRQRKKLSEDLQTNIFKHFVLMNSKGEEANLLEIFGSYNNSIPPSGSGECSAPKLFNYAFRNDMRPIAVAEFWLSKDCNNSLRENGQFYPACESKCRPILDFMLSGIELQQAKSGILQP